MKDGMETFGVFILLLELGGKMPEKGVLKDSDGDITFDDMELMTGFPSKYFKKAIPVLCSGELGWLTDDTRVTPGQDSGDTQPTVHNTTVHNNTEQYITVFETFWETYPLRRGKKVGRKKSFEMFQRIPLQDLERVVRNAKNYGINNSLPKDPERFLKDDFWQDWDEPAKKTDPYAMNYKELQDATKTANS